MPAFPSDTGRRLGIAALVLALAGSAAAEPTRPQNGDLDLRIVDVLSQKNLTYALVRIRNRSGRDLSEMRVRCEAKGRGNDSFRSRETPVKSDSILAGAEERVQVPIPLDRRRILSITCDARGW